MKILISLQRIKNMTITLDELLKSTTNEKELNVVKQAATEFKTGVTYNLVKTEKLKEALLVGYAEHKLKSYRHFNYLPKNHYLKE